MTIASILLSIGEIALRIATLYGETKDTILMTRLFACLLTWALALSPCFAQDAPQDNDSMDGSLSTVTMPYTTDDVRCLSTAMFREAGGEGDRGMIAVGYVVVNRTHTAPFPTKVCSVVYQREGRSCQFSWVCDHRTHLIHNQAAFAHAQDLAKLILVGMAPNPIGTCLFFHESRVRVHYGRALAYQQRVGHQVFYRYIAKS